MKHASFYLVVVLVCLAVFGTAVHAQDITTQAVCENGHLAFPGQRIFLGLDNHGGNPVILVAEPTSSKSEHFATLFAYMEYPKDSGQFVQTQPAASTLRAEPVVLSWGGVSVTVTKCRFFYRYLLLGEDV